MIRKEKKRKNSCPRGTTPRGRLCKYSLARLVLCSIFVSENQLQYLSLKSGCSALLYISRHSSMQLQYLDFNLKSYSVSSQSSVFQQHLSEAEQWQTICQRTSTLHQPLHQQPLHQPQPRTSLGRSRAAAVSVVPDWPLIGT